MKNRLLYILLVLALVSCQKEKPIDFSRDDFSVIPNYSEQVKGQMNIKFKEVPQDFEAAVTRSGIEAGSSELIEAGREIKATGMERVFPYAGKFEARTREAGLHLWYRVTFDESVDLNRAARTLAAVSGVTVVEPELIPKSNGVDFPYDDPYFDQQWYLYNSGIVGGYPVPGGVYLDIDIIDAWKIEKGKREVIVAIVDTPVDVDHEDLKANRWYNPGEYNKYPYYDNDGNGYIGDWYGYNMNVYSTKDNHGTHVAGILAAKNNNGKGICGIAGGDSSDNGVRFMNCEIGAIGIKYAADMGAVICTNSWSANSSTSSQQMLQDAVDYFIKYAGVDENDNQVGPMRGGIVFASAGNDNEELDFHYPASFDNVIGVAALAPDFKKSNYSNWGSWVNISAPGGGSGNGWQIYSTYINNSYGDNVGTSMATPVVAGVAALIVSKFGGVDSGLTPYEVEYRLLRGVKPVDEHNPEYAGKLGVGCVNALLALSDDPVNYKPTITPENIPTERVVLDYGVAQEFIFTVDDKEDGSDLLFEVDDPSGSITATKSGNRITLLLLNKSCVPGDHTITLKVTDRGGITVSTNFSVKLHPEFLEEVEIYPNPVIDILKIRASITFSGEVTAKLYDAVGNPVLSEKVNISLKEAGELDLSEIPGGSYVLKLIRYDKTITKNIIKL